MAQLGKWAKFLTSAKDSSTGKAEIVQSSSDALWTHVKTGGSFKPSQYDTDLTMDATGEALALATGVALGAGRVQVVNQGVTTEAIRVVFGTSAANALLNLTIASSVATTGFYMPSNVDVPGAGIAILGVPALATHIAAGPTVIGDTQLVSITQGV